MSTVLLIVHLFVTLALIGVVLIQRSEGGGLGIGTSQGMGSFMSGRGTANLLTRTTAILATVFMLLALALALLNRGVAAPGHSLLDIPASPSPATPATPAAGEPSHTEPALPGAQVPGSKTPPAPPQATPAAPSTAPGSAAAPQPAPSPTPPPPAGAAVQAPSHTEPAVPGAAPPGTAAPKAPAVPTN